MLLALDSSTEACSVALIKGDEVTEQFLLTPREHTQRLLPMVDEVLAEAGASLTQLDGIAFGRGPGSFTGLRICLGVVQGLAYGADLPVVPVSSLAALAQTTLDKGLVNGDQSVLAALDARMDEVYWAHCYFQQGLAAIAGVEHLSAPEQVRLENISGEVLGAGSGWHYSARISLEKILSIHNDVLPSAGSVAKLGLSYFTKGEFCQADQAMPVYLRDEVAWQKQS